MAKQSKKPANKVPAKGAKGTVTDFTVDSFAAIHEHFAQYRTKKRWAFRGHASSAWRLVPKIGRPPFSGVNETSVFEAWKRRAVEYVPNLGYSDWDWLAIAQHHGLATRLLDWSFNPLVAAFFAVRETHPGSAVVYAIEFNWDANHDGYGPLDMTDVVRYLPRGVVPRITRQGGLFSVHGKPSFGLEDRPQDFVALHRIIIPERYRATLLAELSFYGINNATLFPDLDGLSMHMNWTISSKEYWTFDIPDDAEDATFS